MKGRGGRFLLVLGAGLAAMAFVVVYVVMSKGIAGGTTADVPTVPEMTSVVVVNQDIPAYTMLDGSNTTIAEVEKTTAFSNATGEPSSVYGKMTLVNLTRGQQIQVNLLAESGFSSILQKGQRAFSYAVPERNTFAQGLVENDRVDVLASFMLQYYARIPQADGRFTFEPKVYTSTKTLMQDVAVLRVVRLVADVPSGQQDGVQEAAARPAYAPTSALYSDGAPYQQCWCWA